MEARTSRRDWQLMHALAALSVTTIVAGVIAANTGQTVETIDAFRQLSPAERALRILVGLGAVPVIWLWLRMVADYIRHRPSRHRVAWGVLFFIALPASGLLYFWWVWRARFNPKPASLAA